MKLSSEIVDRLRPMPQAVVGRRLVPLILSRHVLLDAAAHVKLIPTVLQPAGKSLFWPNSKFKSSKTIVSSKYAQHVLMIL